MLRRLKASLESGRACLEIRDGILLYRGERTGLEANLGLRREPAEADASKGLLYWLRSLLWRKCWLPLLLEGNTRLELVNGRGDKSVLGKLLLLLKRLLRLEWGRAPRRHAHLHLRLLLLLLLL